MRETSRFSELTLIESVNLFRQLNQAGFDQLALYFSLQSEIPPGYGMSVENKANRLTTFAKNNPFYQTASGENLHEEIIARAAKLASPKVNVALARALARDGFTLTTDGTVISSLPPVADLPQTNDELHSLLDELDMEVAKGHFDQAIQNHADGNWAATNSQLRPFLEELFNELSRRLAPSEGNPAHSSESLKTRLAKAQPPFLLEYLGEWTGDGKNFVNGLFKRLHAEGPHPGLSGEEDSTFRLHLAMIVARHYLRRARDYKPHPKPEAK